MLRPLRRRAAALTGGLAVVLVLSACGNNPVRTGAAATVGPARITTATLQEMVDRGLSDPQAEQQLGADRASFQRQVLSRLISSRVLAEVAEDEGVTVSAGEVDARLAQFASQLGGQDQLEQQAAQSGIAAQDLRPFIRDLTLNDALGDRATRGAAVPPQQLQALYQQNIAQYDQVVARHILVADRAAAQQVLTQVRADPARFAGLAGELSLDEGSKARGGELDPSGRGAFVKPFEDALFSMRPGEFRLVQTEFGFHVINLIERRTTTLAQAAPELRRQALQPQREQAVSQLLRDKSKELGVKVNPRFGRWDPEQGTVVEAEGNQLSSPAPQEPGDAVLAPEEGADPNAPVDPNADPNAPAGEPVPEDPAAPVPPAPAPQ
ncbi:MAG: PpiC-type peptidyl-prolyl cis-trans isomerase [Frankiales bacterium]|nr:PpiC-type peptidyl-prolyl cis-trans isomerase [Frankiales bacterium]